MAFARWDPLGDLLAIQQHLDRFAPAPSGWTPPVDLREDRDGYLLTAEVPGLRRHDVQIHMDGDRLTISGTRPDVGCGRFHRVERGHGQFSRTFQLPAPVDVDAIQADLRAGVLTVLVPKRVDAGRRIPIS